MAHVELWSICEAILMERRKERTTEAEMSKPDQEEKELPASYERDEWQSVSDLESESDRYREYAAATFRKDRRINIRISQKTW